MTVDDLQAVSQPGRAKAILGVVTPDRLLGFGLLFGGGGLAVRVALANLGAPLPMFVVGTLAMFIVGAILGAIVVLPFSVVLIDPAETCSCE